MEIGKKVIMAPVGREDLPRLFQIRQFKPIVGFMDDELDFNGQGKAMGADPYLLYENHTVQQMLVGQWYFSVWNKKPKELIGAIYTTQVWKDRTIVPTVILDRAYWGKGYADDVCMTMLRWAFQDTLRNGMQGYEMITTYCHKKNKAANALAQRMGFTLMGVHPRPDQEKEQNIYGLRKSEWLAIKNKPPEKKRKGRDGR
jgi:RimJ/RimL family protein N-acetyltransferase